MNVWMIYFFYHGEKHQCNNIHNGTAPDVKESQGESLS